MSGCCGDATHGCMAPASGGRAMRLGFTQGATLDGLRIETSCDGLWIASTADVGDGAACVDKTVKGGSDVDFPLSGDECDCEACR